MHDCHFLLQQNGDQNQSEHIRASYSITCIRSHFLYVAWVVGKESASRGHKVRRVSMVYLLLFQLSPYSISPFFKSSFIWVSNEPSTHWSLCLWCKIFFLSANFYMHSIFSIQTKAPKNGSKFSKIPRARVYLFWFWSSRNFVVVLVVNGILSFLKGF